MAVAVAAQPVPSVVVVLAGGGAKGFAHLAVLRQLEQDRVPIARIVGTSMGAVVGGLYAAGLSTDEIERVVGGLDPSKVALDQLNRLELPSRVRARQQKYPVDFEFGIRNGAPSFARGVSDGQRFLALLQNLTAHVPPDVNFNDLKIPFRAVATRFRDGEMKVFDRGDLHLAIRASMAAPAVFAPVELQGETYVDGGLVANLPIEVALQEGADVVVASYLAGGSDTNRPDQASHALVVANRMIDILIRQNEKRNLALLRPQDILVTQALQDVGFADFNRASEIVRRGQEGVSAQSARWGQLKAQINAQHMSQTQAQLGAQQQAQQEQQAQHTERTLQADLAVPELPKKLSYDQREKRIVAIRAEGQRDVPERYIQSMMAPLLNTGFSSLETEIYVDQLYTSGFFDLVNYSLIHQAHDGYTLLVRVREKPYSPHFMKAALGFSTELGGVTQFSWGVGYRRPWLNASGLEFSLDARLGTQSELAARLYQPLSKNWSLEGGLKWDRHHLPFYRTALDSEAISNQKLAYLNQSAQSLDAQLVYDFRRKANIKWGLTSSRMSSSFDTQIDILDSDDTRFVTRYNGLRTEVEVDQLDSLSFPTRGYYFQGRWEQGISGNAYQGGRLHAKIAGSLGPHSFNAGLNWARDRLTRECDKCISPSQLYLGGFQQMGAYRMGQLTGTDVAHVQGTYMYRLSEGGLFKQPTFVGTVLEAGDAWREGHAMRLRYSGTLFVAVDSKIGDVYLGAAKGTGGVYNLFFQLGRRFSF